MRVSFRVTSKRKTLLAIADLIMVGAMDQGMWAAGKGKETASL